MKTPQTIIFDLNGVFIQSPKLSDRFKADFSVPEEVFLIALKEIMDKVRRPGADMLFSYWQPYFKKWGVELNNNEFLNYWFGAESENREMVDLARDLKARGVSLLILSNNFKERAEYYQKHFPFMNEIFDKIYYSWQTGFVKPDVNCFKLILDDNNLIADNCLYFDDSEKNIEVARSLGFKAFVFENSEQVKKLV